jgi:flagellar capping protein FliD
MTAEQVIQFQSAQHALALRETEADVKVRTAADASEDLVSASVSRNAIAATANEQTALVTVANPPHRLRATKLSK